MLLKSLIQKVCENIYLKKFHKKIFHIILAEESFWMWLDYNLIFLKNDFT